MERVRRGCDYGRKAQRDVTSLALKMEERDHEKRCRQLLEAGKC